MIGLAGIAGALAGLGIVQCVSGLAVTWRFAAKRTPLASDLPPMTILKPLHGDEPLLERALATVCAQDYPTYQIVFGVQSNDDPAIGVVRRLQARFPGSDIALVCNAALHGTNRKVSNLINMLPAAKHGILVIADSDLHVQPDYLRSLATAIAAPDVGLVTTLYAGFPANTTVPARLGSTQITHSFLPGALMARSMGRQDCLGATMCLTRQTLTRIGGLRSLVDHLADDNVLGRLVSELGFKVALATSVPATTVPETTFAALFRHELRWARTIRALEPAGFAASALQYPLFWAALAITLSAGASWSIGLLLAAWVVRAAAGVGIDRALAPKLAGFGSAGPIWLLPLRDALSIGVMLTSYTGKRVDWRGHTMQATPSPAIPCAPMQATPLMRATPPSTQATLPAANHSHPAPFRRAEGLTQQ